MGKRFNLFLGILFSENIQISGQAVNTWTQGSKPDPQTVDALVLFRSNSAKSSIAQEERLATSP